MMKFLSAIVAVLFVATSVSMTPGLASAAGKKAEKEEQMVSMDQVPAPVKATLEKEAKGGTVGQITQETAKGKTYYEAEIDKNGKKRYVHVAPDGKVLKHESAKKEAKEEATK